ncbi:MAG: tetratricopeptide repeat protein [Desulfomonilaceae bacterium]
MKTKSCRGMALFFLSLTITLFPVAFSWAENVLSGFADSVSHKGSTAVSRLLEPNVAGLDRNNANPVPGSFILAKSSSSKKADRNFQSQKSAKTTPDQQKETSTKDEATTDKQANPSPNTKVDSKESSATSDKSNSEQKEALPKTKATRESVTNLIKTAEEKEKTGNWDNALSDYKSAVEQSKSIKDRKLEALALRGSSRCDFHMGRIEEAIELIEKAIEINKSTKNARGRSLDLIMAGQISMAQRDYSKAVGQFEEAQKILPSSEFSVLPDLLFNLAKSYIELQRSKEALAVLNRLAAYYAKNNENERLGHIQVKLADIYLAKGDNKNAEQELMKAQKIFSDINQPKQVAQILFRLSYLQLISGDVHSSGNSLKEALRKEPISSFKWAQSLQDIVNGIDLYKKGKLDKASEQLSKAVSALREDQYILLKSRAELVLAKINLETGNWNSAKEMVTSALKGFESFSILDGQADAEETLAQILFRQSSVKDALDHSDKALAIYKKIKNKDRIVDCKILEAEIHEVLGNPAVSLKLLKEALEDSKAGIDRATMNYLRLAVAKFRLTRENPEKALEAASEAKKDFAAMNDQVGVAEANLVLGLAYELNGNIDKSHESLEQALKFHEQRSDRFSEGKDLTALGIIYKNLGSIDKAEETFQKAMELRKSLGDLRGYAANLANLANIYRRKSQNEKAAENLKEALSIYQQVSDKKGEADALTNLGNLDAIDGAYQGAMEKFQKALQIHRETSDIRGIATDLISISSLYLVRGDIDNGLATLKEAETYNKRIFNPVGNLAILSEMATVSKARRNFPEALTNLAKAMQIAKSLKDSKAISSINLRISSVYAEMGDFPKALKILDQSRVELAKEHDVKGLAWAIGETGIIQAKTEDYENAINNLKQASQIREQYNIISSQSQDVDYYLAEIYQGFKAYDRALEYYHKALSSSQAPGGDKFVGKIYDRIGNIYFGMEEYSKARDFLEDALRISLDTGDTKKQKAQLIKLGDTMSKLKDPEAGLKYLQKALTLTSDTKDTATQARVLTRMGTLNQVQGRPKTALENYTDAMDLRNKLGDKRGVSENLLQIALVNAILGDFDQSVANLKRGMDIAQASEDRSMLWKAYFIMGRTLEEKKSFGEALEAYRKALSIVDAMDVDYSEESEEDDFIFGGTSALFETTLRVLMNLAKKDPEGAYDNQALRLVERLKASSFENTLSKINVPSYSNIPNDLVIKEKSLRLSLNRFNEKLMLERSKLRPNPQLMKKLLQERRVKETSFAKLRDQLSRDYPSYVNLTKPKPISIHQIQKSLDPEEVLLEYMVTRGRTYIFAIDKYRFHTFSIDYPWSEMEKDVGSLIGPLQKHETLASWDPSVAYKIYSRIVKPVEYMMTGKKAVVVIPNGPLCWVPFEILVESKSHETKRFWSPNDRPSYLLEKYTFSYAESSYSLCLYRSRKAGDKPGWNLVAFGDPIFSDPDRDLEENPGAQKILASLDTSQAMPNQGSGLLKPLHGGRKEILEITKILSGPCQTYLGKQATETLFKKADLSRYLYIHLATYGVLSSGAGRLRQQPAIVFSLFGDKESDGFLELGEVFGLNLRAEMVVLSSLLTPGKNMNFGSNALYDLARGFLFAGAGSMAMSLWQVNEEHSQRLLLEMFKNLKEGSKSEALRKAKLSILHGQGTSHPYYWGSFILVGDWKPRFLPDNSHWEPESVGVKGVSTWRKLFNM